MSKIRLLNSKWQNCTSWPHPCGWSPHQTWFCCLWPDGCVYRQQNLVRSLPTHARTLFVCWVVVVWKCRSEPASLCLCASVWGDVCPSFLLFFFLHHWNMLTSSQKSLLREFCVSRTFVDIRENAHMDKSGKNRRVFACCTQPNIHSRVASVMVSCSD